MRLQDRYAIRGGAPGRERLRLLSGVMQAGTEALLDAAGIRVGDRCLDIGCGGGDVAFELARRVGPTGHVLGIDLDADKIELARGEAAALGLCNITFEVRDLGDWTPPGDCNVAYARFLLSHLSAPGGLLKDLARHLPAGALVIAEDVDFRGHFAEPPCPALDRYVQLYAETSNKRGGNACLGPRLPALMRDAGLEDLHVSLHQPVAMDGGIKALTAMTFDLVADALRADGVPDEELQAVSRQLRACMEDPRTLHGGPRVFQCWGRVPG